MARKINTIVIHCSDTDVGDVESIRRYHIEHNGWKDIGYHYVINRSGTIQQGRPEWEVGAHVMGHNLLSLGICLVGVSEFTDAQLDSLAVLCQQLSTKYTIPNKMIKCHYEFDTAYAQGKTCPNMPAFLLRRFLRGFDGGNGGRR